jgi:pyruvate formate lyase activating enzyme
MMEQIAPVIAISRLRMMIDGPGITTLVCFHGCPLRCHWCLNPFSFAPDTNRKLMTAGALYEKLRLDALYFISTGGGVTFGGGEPLLYPGFLQDFRGACGESWHLCVETSLSVPWENVALAAAYIDHFIVDCKDTNPDVYRRYTGCDNQLMLSNLEKLLTLVGPDRITVRVPLIPGFNTEADQSRSRGKLEEMGIRNFDLFTYKTKR